MNKVRRQKIGDAVLHIQSAERILSSVMDDEQDAMDNMPENLQESERYSTMEDAVDCLDDVISTLDETIESLNEIINS